LDPSLRGAALQLVEVVRRAGIQATVTSVLRSRAKQAKLYRAWKAGRSRFPAALPGTSKHERGLAFDLVISPASYQRDVGLLWESWGGRWGGRFDDPIHFEI
jgi:LAS superfamily LD-carboxypeptidase LdcB